MSAVSDVLTTNVEGAVLGIILQEPEAITQVKDMLQPTDFLAPENRALYSAMLTLAGKNRPIDVRFLADELSDRMNTAGGPSYWAGLILEAPTPLSLLQYVEAVQQHSQRARLHEALDEIGRISDPDQAMETMRERLGDIEQIRQRVEWDDRAESADRLTAWITETQTETSRGLQTGLPSLDYYLNGMRPKQLIVIGARTGVGKTSLGVTITHHVGMVRHHPVLFLSAEMDRDAIRQKLLSIAANIPWFKLDAQDLTDAERQRALRHIEAVRTAPVFVLECSGWTTTQIRRWARAVHTVQPLSLVVADYLQYIRPPRKTESRYQEVGDVARELKHMAMEMDLPVVAPAQLNRESEGGARSLTTVGPPRKSPEPTLKDLRESADIEQTANVVILMWKERDSTDEMAQPDAVEPVLVKVAKNRMGKRGKFTSGFRADRMQFCELGAADEPF